MKLTQHRIFTIFSTILALVVGSGMWVLTTENTLAQNACFPQPQPNINQGYEIPINPEYTSPCENINFGAFAWDAFVALNWPADSDGNPLQDETIGNAPDKHRVWEYYEFPEQVFGFEEAEANQHLRFAEFGSKFGEPINREFLRSNSDSESDTGIILPNGFKPLVDRAGNYVLNEIRMNPVEVNQILSQGWNSVEGLMPFAEKLKPFELMCSARTPRGTYPQESDVADIYDNNVPCSVDDGNDSVGTIEIKAAWMVLPDPDEPLPSDGSPLPDPAQYYTSTRTLYVRTPEDNRGETTRVEIPVALVGFHLLHKTSQFGWIWSTFEHIDNAPYSEDISTTQHYNLYDPDCTGNCKVNTPLAKKPYLWQLDFPHAVTRKKGIVEAQTPSQITRLSPIQDYAQSLNKEWQAALPAFWKNYQLIGVQWLQNPYIPYERLRNVQPGKLANTTLEPYVQKTERGSSCIACHTLAKLPLPHPNSVRADFSFLLKNAKPSLP